MSSLVKICPFLPARYLVISNGILKPAAPAMIVAGISKMACGRIRRRILLVAIILSVEFARRIPKKYTVIRQQTECRYSK